MGRPSMFSRDYHKVMRRRKIVFRLIVILIAAIVIFFAYNKSAIIDLKKIIADLGGPSDNINQIESQKSPGETAGSGSKTGEDTKKNVGTLPNNSSDPKDTGTEIQSTGEYIFTYPDNTELHITYTVIQNDIKITGIAGDNTGIDCSISDDGKSIVFDNPNHSGVWIYNADTSSKRLDPDTYTQIGGDELVFYREDVVGDYENYTWAAKPVFLKDGRIIYQSCMPWFKEENNIYLWIVDSSGENNRFLADTKVMNLVNYSGFTEDGMLIVEINGGRYKLNIDSGSLQGVS